MKELWSISNRGKCDYDKTLVYYLYRYNESDKLNYYRIKLSLTDFTVRVNIDNKRIDIGKKLDRLSKIVKENEPMNSHVTLGKDIISDVSIKEAIEALKVEFNDIKNKKAKSISKEFTKEINMKQKQLKELEKEIEELTKRQDSALTDFSELTRRLNAINFSVSMNIKEYAEKKNIDKNEFWKFVEYCHDNYQWYRNPTTTKNSFDSWEDCYKSFKGDKNFSNKNEQCNIAGKMKCDDCDCIFDVTHQKLTSTNIKCPQCNSNKVKLIKKCK